KVRILLTRSRHHCDKATAGTVDVVDIVVAAELRVGDIEEIRPAGHRLKGVPGLDVGHRVVSVAVGSAKLHRDATVGISRQDKQQLLQIRAMILGIPKSYCWGSPTADRIGLGTVLAAEADRRSEE